MEMDADGEDIDDEEMTISLNNRLTHGKWQYRRNAYRHIGQRFKEGIITNEENEEEDPYELYQPWLL